MISGTEIQSMYQTYWLEKGYLEEQKLTKQDLNDFVKYSGYNKVLFLIVNSPVVEKTRQGRGGWGVWVQSERTRASIGIKSFLADETSIIKATDVTKEDDSDTSELRAKRGAFEKCMKEIQGAIGSLISIIIPVGYGDRLFVPRDGRGNIIIKIILSQGFLLG